MQRLLFIICLVLCFVKISNAEEKISLVSTRQGVTIPIYINEAPKATKVLLMFTGGMGQHFSESGGVIKLSKNFLARTSAQFVKKGFTIVILGAPSDQHNTFSDKYRNSPEHLEDVDRVIHYLAAMGYKEVYLVATSRGTLSAAYLASELKNDTIKGLVLTSTLEGPKFLRWIKLENIPYPVLLVHHKNDLCKVTSFEEAQQSAQRMKNSPKVDFVGVTGGLPPASDPCEALSNHGFFGIEDQVVDIIAKWVSGNKQ